jgi:hypothetical protein
MVTNMTKQRARNAARRTTTAMGLTGNTVRTVRFKLRNLLVDSPKLLWVRNCYAIWVRNAGADRWRSSAWPAILHSLRSPDRYNGRWRLASGIASDSGQTIERAAMKLHTCTRGLLAGAISVMALAGGTGVAHAQPDPIQPPVPGITDLLITSTPSLWVDPRDEGGPSTNWGGVGMFCENQFVRCR